MIGFPGETEDDFDKTLKAIKEIGFKWVTFFRYYDAEGTTSLTMGNKISDDVIRKRIKKMKRFMYKNNIPWL
jgi:tRNA-2-methylthio-N6-dimethylallyladenosine synthase